MHAEFLPASPPQSGLKFQTVFSPMRFFRPRLLFKIFDLGLDGCCSLHMLPLRLFQRRLSLVDDLLPALVLLLPGGLLPRPFKFPALLFPFVGERCVLIPE